MMHATAHLSEPVLELRDGTPFAQAFDDVYFSRAGGVAETDYVFLRGNGLPERWAGQKRFTVAELGFGTGLNFLVAWKRFRETAAADAVLHFISVEKFPFKLDILRSLLALQPELVREAEALLAVYPLRLPGIHRVHLPQAVLTLCFGEATELLPQLNTPIDAWFLDGFSPAKNPAMWSEEVLSQIGRLSGPGTSFATFTAAGAVKRGLEAARFAVEKVPGFGHKREMLVGKWSADGAASAPSPLAGEGRDEGALKVRPDGEAPSPLLLSPPPTSPPRGEVWWGASLVASPARGEAEFGVAALPPSILIIGAGVAGATLAWTLAKRGLTVTVLERGDVAGGASGNAASVLFPQLTKRWNVSAAWYFTAYGFMLRQLARWQGIDFARGQPGMLRLPRHAEEEAQLRALNETLGLDTDIVHWLPREEASVKAGLELQTGAAFFPQGSWLNPQQLCAALLQHEAITVRTNAAAKKLMRVGDQWQVTLEDGAVIAADRCCVAAASESAALLTDYGITLNAVGGQVSVLAADNAATKLRSIVCLKGYVIPQGADRYLVGATYHRDDLHAVTQARHAENLAELEATLPGWFSGEVIGGRSALRATTPDRLPYIGAVAEGLYVSTGHGSRGMLSAPLAAEMIASEICGEQSPVSADLGNAVRPLRFKKS